jgi:hypothetical protein
MGNWVHLESKIAVLVRQGFMNLFCTSKVSVPHRLWSINNWNACLSAEDCELLSLPITRVEVKAALWSFKPFKAPGLMGFMQDSFKNPS